MNRFLLILPKVGAKEWKFISEIIAIGINTIFFIK